MNRATSATGWVKNPDGTQGYTWNPITGCLNGCEYCYARKLANGRLRSRYLANTNILSGYTLARGVLNEQAIPPNLDPFYPRFWEDRLGEPLKGNRYSEVKDMVFGKPKGIFTCDMSDLFGIGIPDEWTRKVMGIIKLSIQHRFYLLTKQPQNLIKFSPFPDNCFVGVSATNREMYLRATGAEGLDGIEAKVKYISFEPLLEAIHPSEYRLKGINWVIIGGQSGKEKFYPPEEWIKEIELACDKVRIPVFEKDNLRKVWYNTPRQEIPTEGDYAKRRGTQTG